MTIEKKLHQSDIDGNMATVYCFTCWSAGKILYEHLNGYTGSEVISEAIEHTALEKAQQHNEKFPTHRIIYWRFENTH